MPDIFLSYNRDDQATARRFAEGFEREGFSVWWDATLKSGEAYDRVTEQAVRDAKAVAVLWSKKSVESDWVRAEATIALRNKTLMPVMIEPCERPIMFELTHTADLSHWKGDAGDEAWRSYVADVRRFVRPREPNPSVAHAPVHAQPGRRFGATSLAIVAAAVMVAGAALWAVMRKDGEPSAAGAAMTPAVASAAVAGPAAPAEPRTSIAVMPFANLTGDASKDYLGDGMAEEVINTLTQVPGLKVPARTSSFAYKGRNTDIRQICKDLGVGTILEGSVRTAGKRIRITAQLINGQDGLHIWSHTYDEQFTDLFKLQDDLATAIVQALRSKLNTDLPATVTGTAPTQDVEAYQLYLQATGAVGAGAARDFRQSIALFSQALERDPKFARALAGRANMEFALSTQHDASSQLLGDAERDATQALALSPGLAEAHAVLGETNALRGHWIQSQESFRAAIAADPSDGFIRSQHALVLLASTGQLREALAEATAGQQLAPANGFCALALAYIESWLGNDADALRSADLSARLGASGMPDVRAVAAARRGDYTDAVDLWMRASPAVIPDGGTAVLRLVYSAQTDSSKRAAAREALQALVGSAKGGADRATFVPIAIGLFSTIDGLDRAYDLANQLLDSGGQFGTINAGLLFSLWTPESRQFRTDPRFQNLVRRLGLMDYWKQYGPPQDCQIQGGKLVCL
jgi:TolB-like protein